MIHRIRLLLGCAAAMMIAVLAPHPASAQTKVALVIGNSDYKNVFSLKNPVNDAADVGAALKRIGFEVAELSNANNADMKRALKQFGERAKLAEIAVVFYSGHALQSDGVAWLLASDGQARSLADVTKTSVSLPEVVAQLDGVEKIGMVFIDAARNDPFNEGAKRLLPSGLVKQVEEPKNVLISYATGAGRKVADGEGRNSPFTTALLKHIEEPGLEIIAMMKRIRDDVARSTGNEQIPSFYISAADDVYFVAALPELKPATPTQPETPAAPLPPAEAAKPVEAAPAPEKSAAAPPASPAPARPIDLTPAPAPLLTPEKAAEPAPAPAQEKAAEAPPPAPAVETVRTVEKDSPPAAETTAPAVEKPAAEEPSEKKHPND